jgi:hypothetical protein
MRFIRKQAPTTSEGHAEVCAVAVVEDLDCLLRAYPTEDDVPPLDDAVPAETKEEHAARVAAEYLSVLWRSAPDASKAAFVAMHRSELRDKLKPAGEAEGDLGVAIDTAWESAPDEERAEFVIGHKMQIRGYFVARTKKACAAILTHPDFKGDPFVYRHMQSLPDLLTEGQDHALQQEARRLGIEH